MRELVIGSRGSKLALWQAEWVGAELISRDPQLEIRIEIIRTSGDMNRDQPLKVIGGKGVFTKELEQALLEERIDLAVHSLKDLPTIIPDGLAIAAITEREDARDALVLRDGTKAAGASLKSLPRGAVVGTSSQRRLAQLKHLRPDIEVKDLRGNVDTRLRKLDAGWYDALILAVAGLRRLGSEERISMHISPDEMLPAIGQGALGIEVRDWDAQTIAIVSALNHAATRAACLAERAFLRNLGGGCQVPIAAHCTVDGSKLKIDGLVAEETGKRLIRDSVEGSFDEAEIVGNVLANRLRELGAEELLASPPA